MRTMKILRLLRRRRDDERGATFVLTAVCMVALLGGGAMGVDVGFTVDGSRAAQAMADTGALDLARYVNVADGFTQLSGSQAYMAGKLANVQTDNSGSNATFTVTPCIWTGSTCTVPTGVNAGCYAQVPTLHAPCTGVIVTATQNVPQIFFGGASSVTRTAIAAVTPEDGFSIGTYLASFDSQQSGVLNAILSTLGTTANVTAVGYQGLANTYVTINQLIAASAGVATLTPSNILTTSLKASDWLTILMNATNTQKAAQNCGASPVPSPCNAYTALQSLDFGSTSVELCQLFSINGSTCGGGNVSVPGMSANLDVLQFLTTEAELANGSNAINVQSALGITGVTSSTLSLVVGQLPQVAYGPGGTTATTAQVTADLKLGLLGVAGIVDIPLTAAQGTATLNAVTCLQTNNSLGQALVRASTTTATAAITLGGVSAGTLTITGVGTTTKGFISTVIPPTASTQSANTNPVQIGTTSPVLSWSGLSAPLSGLPGLMTGVLGPVLQATGVTVGGATIADLNYNCGAVSIVK
jgi:uncharacterized membrane protein